MSAFKWRHFAGEVILWAVRWSCRYGISYRELEAMLNERGVAVDHTTLYRWTQRYAPELDKRTAWYRSRLSFSWRVDETYVRVKGRWKYLYRAIDKGGGFRCVGWLRTSAGPLSFNQAARPKTWWTKVRWADMASLGAARTWPLVSIAIASTPTKVRRAVQKL